MNYFQNLYLCDSQQQEKYNSYLCSVLWITFKICIFWLPTTKKIITMLKKMLWITFKICIFVTSNNKGDIHLGKESVVNYFQNLYLCDLKQLGRESLGLFRGCELLSKFVSLWSPTTVIFLSFVIISCELLSKFVSLRFPTTNDTGNLVSV